MKNQVLYALEVARALHELGEYQATDELLAEIETFCRDQSGACLSWLFVAEYDLGLRERAWKHAADALKYPNQTSAVMTKLFGSSTTATVWWEFLQLTQPRASRVERLDRLRQLLQPSDSQSDLDVVAIAYQADKLSAKRLAGDVKNTSQRDRWLRAISHLCEIHGKIELGRYLSAAGTTKRAKLLATRRLLARTAAVV